ncbi:uncharacterized protein ACLA_018450 [Aspergillus clavatus NRRL 1]|uniref:Uncharacterized protein n=1 Tax=Aspergillus clavatus (strain ATCC 1007 / CBS 513.65 / DSM 816 / NCTC 3887 / NRRL 1 / QM 1276 / 107) TaxID=344612 RepID=A1CNC0_ASPCL|nr:uncharacterized protein ACLA_018450 [Aspergillus clavatus NRRL 1]EAW07141.1 hypothetical protein ACLA_018450 [Aspergillus clavatus NRRL 1]
MKLDCLRAPVTLAPIGTARAKAEEKQEARTTGSRQQPRVPGSVARLEQTYRANPSTWLGRRSRCLSNYRCAFDERFLIVPIHNRNSSFNTDDGEVSSVEIADQESGSEGSPDVAVVVPPPSGVLTRSKSNRIASASSPLMSGALNTPSAARVSYQTPSKLPTSLRSSMTPSSNRLRRHQFNGVLVPWPVNRTPASSNAPSRRGMANEDITANQNRQQHAPDRRTKIVIVLDNEAKTIRREIGSSEDDA